MTTSESTSRAAISSQSSQELQPGLIQSLLRVILRVTVYEGKFPQPISGYHQNTPAELRFLENILH